MLFNGCANGFRMPSYVSTYIHLNIYNLLHVDGNSIKDEKKLLLVGCIGFVFNPSTQEL